MLKYIKNFKAFIKLNESIKVEKLDPVTYEDETVITLPYTNLIKDNRQDFLKKLVRICKDLNIKPIWLMHTIFHESRFDPKKAERISGGSGLLSFLPIVLKEFVNDETGKSMAPNDVLEMPNIDQLDLIRAFYQTWFETMQMKDSMIAGDFAAITFYPGVIKKDLEWEFPNYVIEKNADMFKEFKAEGKTKKAYYNYIEEILNKEDEYNDSNDYLLGEFSGAIAEPKLYLTKKPLEYYKDLILSIEDPGLNQQGLDNTEENKQIG